MRRSLKKTRQRRRGDGTMAAVRTALPTIYQLRAEGVHWSEIASALGRQGVTQGKGKNRIPITTTRLTSLVTQIEHATATVNQQPRRRPSQTEQTSETNALQNHRVSLALELNTKTEALEREPGPSEEDLRRAALDRIQDVLRKD
jgi:hypothetical protein